MNKPVILFRFQFINLTTNYNFPKFVEKLTLVKIFDNDDTIN